MDIHRETDKDIPQRPSSSCSSRSGASESSDGQGPDSRHFSDDPETFVLSGANTPVHEQPDPHLGDRETWGSCNISRLVGVADPWPVPPRQTRTAASPALPAPLSARGDILGGYFPFHEDPAKRVHRTHPFYRDEARLAKSATRAGATAPKTAPSLPSIRSNAEPARAPFVPLSNTPVTSYLPSGHHGATLPMGKYYPSNYENRAQHQTSRTTPRSTPQGMANSHGGHHPHPHSHSQQPRLEGDARQKLQQYQRDMIAQATLAARKLMGGSSGANLTVPGLSSHALPTSAPAAVNPVSPRLRPLGSPGPVTPMELESSGGSYLDVGKPSSAADRSSRERERHMPISPGGRMRAETRSPVATPAF